MSTKNYPYDPDLPYVVEVVNEQYARFKRSEDARRFKNDWATARIIDTTPKPRIPDDAKWITYSHARTYAQLFAFRGGDEWVDHDGDLVGRLEDLPGVTPDTVFTVLEERRES